MKKIILNILIILYLVQCTTVDEAGKILRNEKTNSTDEFLIKKNDPLSIPPNIEDLPEPGGKNTQDVKSQKKSQDIFNTKVETKKKETSEIEKLIITYSVDKHVSFEFCIVQKTFATTLMSALEKFVTMNSIVLL